MSDTIQTIRRSVKHFFSGTLLSRIAGMGRDMAMAYAFGTHASIASFMVAFRLAHLLRRLFGEGALQAAFIPEFETLRRQNKTQAFFFFRNLYLSLTLFLLTLIAIGSLSLSLFLFFGHPSDENREILYLTLLILPSLLFICLYGLNASLLQCEKIYFTPSVAPVAFNFIWILTIILLRTNGYSDLRAMPLLSIGVVFACFCQWLLTVPSLIQLLKSHLSLRRWENIQINGPDIKKMTGPLLLGIVGVAAFQINNAIDSIFARYAELEGPALLWYAMRIQQLPLALFGVAFSGAILPPLSRAIKALDWVKYNEFLCYALKQTLFFIVPVTALLFILGDTSVNLLYGRGNFTDHSIIGTTRCLWAYGLGLLPTTLVLILAPACYAQNDYRFPTYASFLTVLINCLLNTLFIIGLGLGAVSVALATSVSAWVNFFFLTLTLSKKNGAVFSRGLIIETSRFIFISSIASIGTLFLKSYQQSMSLTEIVFNFSIFSPKSFLLKCLYFLSQFLCFIGIWGSLTLCFNKLTFKLKNINNKKTV